MAELGKHGKRKASSEDGPSNFPLFSHMADDDENLGGDDRDRDRDRDRDTRQDPLEVFGSEIMTVMLSKVDARSVAIARLVCRGWHAVASSDKIWAPKWNFAILGKDVLQTVGRRNLFIVFILYAIQGCIVYENISFSGSLDVDQLLHHPMVTYSQLDWINLRYG
ncbi:hypothetical protein BUALT_Bualt12G0103700 [Buddleja alternifolia]|uniref:F-box domain-containing protein n=1 Tax=Buddleja alternifolia TaxID=168488 RepID=A0AAV6WP38_9LAMI|nr:hypothetical protein BUALT_Bualt12G0103700 [Buddleja alternifolia]